MQAASEFVGFNGSIIVSLIAFPIVFMVLAGLAICISAIRLFVGAPKPAASAAGGAGSSGSAAQPSNNASMAVAVPSAGGDRAKIVAAISGALVAARGAGFRITSITPDMGGAAVLSNCAPENRMWRAAGIMDVMGSRLNRSWKD